MEMNSQTIYVITIANSIIGVGILAMPYCFKQCGILLSTLLLILSSILSRISCHLLLKSAIISRRRTFEVLAFHTFGPLGKFIIELGIIGFLLGTSIAFFVVMGDLGPAIISNISGVVITETIRTTTLLALALFCVLPLGLLRNIDSLSSVCVATIGFYFCLVLMLMAESLPHILSNDWIDKVEWWRPAGILQCLPIFSMALFCQTQLFEIYQSIPNASLEKMNSLIRQAVNICTSVYIFVGIFGYIAFPQQTLSGNILMNFTPSLLTEVMKIGFVLSVAFSFPMVIFPCRASLNSLIYKKSYVLHEGTTNYIPEGRFKVLTFLIVFLSLAAGVMTPSVERVLGLVGSVVGIMICLVFPATCFISVSSKNTNERITAQIILFVSIIVMVLGTYSNLYSSEISSYQTEPEPKTAVISHEKPPQNSSPSKSPLEYVQLNNKNSKENIENNIKEDIKQKIPDPKLQIIATNEEIQEKLATVKPLEDGIKEIRHEPPQPIEPVEVKETQAEVKVPVEMKVEEPPAKKDINEMDAAEKAVGKSENENQVEENIVNRVQESHEIKKEDSMKVSEPKKEAIENAPVVKVEANVTTSSNKVEEVDIEAIKKEERELQEDGKKDDVNHSDILKHLKEHNVAQQQIAEGYKKLLSELKVQEIKKEELKKINEAELKAVKNIETMVKEAISRLSPDAKKLNETAKVLEDSLRNELDELSNLNKSIIKSKELASPLVDNLKVPSEAKGEVPIVLAMANNISVVPNRETNVEVINADVKKEIKLGDESLHQNQIDGDKKPPVQKVVTDKAPNPKDNINLMDILQTKTNQIPDTKKDKEDIAKNREIRSVDETDLPKQEDIGEEICERNNPEVAIPTTNNFVSTVAPLKENNLGSQLNPLNDIDLMNRDESMLKHVERDLQSFQFHKRR